MFTYIISALLLGGPTAGRAIIEARCWLSYFGAAFVAWIALSGEQGVSKGLPSQHPRRRMSTGSQKTNSVLNYVAIAKRPSTAAKIMARQKPGSRT
jgi:hypothetical protein